MRGVRIDVVEGKPVVVDGISSGRGRYCVDALVEDVLEVVFMFV